MLKKIIHSITAFSVLFILASLVTTNIFAHHCGAPLNLDPAACDAQHLAQAGNAGSNDFQITEPGQAITNIPNLIGFAVQILFIIAGLVAFVYLLLGGIKWITSGGDKGQVEAARNQIIQALIGLVVVFLAWGIIVLVERLLGLCLGFSCAFDLPDPDVLRD